MISASFYGLNVRIEYNPVNLRFTGVFWTIPLAETYRVKIFQDSNLLYETTLIGPQTGSNEVIMGNRRLVEIVDPNDGRTYLAFPDGLTVNVEKIA